MSSPRFARFRAFLAVSAALIVTTAVIAGLLVGIFFENYVRAHEE